MQLNSQYFNAASVEAGEMDEFIKILNKQSYGKSSYYNDVHHYPVDCGAFIVEWIQRPWDNSFDAGRFTTLAPDEVKMIEKTFPDGHYERFFDEEEYNEAFEQWLKDNPHWVRTPYGTWTNEEENRKFREELEQEQSRHKAKTGEVKDE